MPLHPDLAAFLDLANDARRLPMSAMSAPAARLAYDRATLGLDSVGAELPVESLALRGRGAAAIGARLYRGSAGPGLAPTLLFFHGGGYVLGGLDSHDSLCRDLAAATPCAVLAIDYRRAPEHRFPAAFEDAEDAHEWLLRHGPEHGLDGSRIAIAGDSVGGTLATALCLAARAAGRRQPLLQLLLYPCTAARQDSESHRRLARGHLLEADTLRWMFDQYLRDERDRLDWRFAPAEADSLAGLAPARIDLAEYDPLVDEGRAYARRLADAGVPVELRLHAGMVHDFARLGNVVGESAALRRDLARALAQALRTEAARAG
ncbi:alpha/beta hydrolase [Derxia lacustris]|uniref:alpha/beta hydrolase n=1 Tax=Derxia lacustris TaxID=764842 RepID=UPI000A16E04B|nr:alpha/beta hydrolase [Derxia lacustris]